MWQRVVRISFLILGLVILAVSIVRTTLEMTIADEKDNNLRKVLIEADIINRDGKWESIDYKFPETRMLPTNLFYFVKKVRDYLWIGFTKDPIDKSRLALLLADKQMEEVRIMDRQRADKQIIIGTTIEAINKLKLASDKLKESQSNQIESQQIQNQINQTIYVYKKIIQTLQIEEREKQQILKGLEEVV